MNKVVVQLVIPYKTVSYVFGSQKEKKLGQTKNKDQIVP